MSLKTLEPVERLLVEFEVRRAKNPRYSLRAFATSLGLSAGRLSEFLSGKRQLNRANSIKVASALALTPTETKIWLKNCGFSASREAPIRLSQKPVQNYVQLEDDQFHIIADWEHFAILTYLETDLEDKSEGAIASRLGINELTARLALNRLMRLGMVSKEGTQFQKETPPLSTTSDIASSALRKSHRQTLEQAMESLEKVPVELRDITSITIPTNMKKLALAKKLIKDFRRRLAAVLEDGEKTEVYNLNIQLVPLTSVTQEKK